jgi:hypothetical protein
MEQWRDHGDVPLYCVLLKAGTVCKNRDKLITFIVRVIVSALLFVSVNELCYLFNNQSVIYKLF